MNHYQFDNPRAVLGVVAAAMTAITFSLMVGLPAPSGSVEIRDATLATAANPANACQMTES